MAERDSLEEFSRRIESKIVKTRFGYHATTTHGPSNVGECGLSAFTRRGIERKVDRLHRYLRRLDEAYDNAKVRAGFPSEGGRHG